MSRGVLALVGGGEWSEGCSFDADLLAASGAGDEARADAAGPGTDVEARPGAAAPGEAATGTSGATVTGRRPVVTLLPTAAAFEQPDAVVAHARRYFDGLGADVEVVAALDRSAAEDPALAAMVADARFLYLASGSAMHLLSVFKRTRVWAAVQSAYHGGAVVAAAGTSAAVLCDAMVDPRGGGFGVGLGLVTQLTLIPRFDRWSAEKSKRTIELAPAGLALAGIPDRTALVRGRDGRWRVAGAGEVRLFKDRRPAGLDILEDA